MEYKAAVQSALDEIDRRITENIRADELARAANYSTYHFCRIFMALTGTPVMAYVTRRKLEHALYDLSRGKKVVDAAMAYGFETHAGFTKAFKKCFGYPPSLVRLRVFAGPPGKATVESAGLPYGGSNMQVQVKETKPKTVVGYASRHKMPNVSKGADIPAFCYTINLNYAAELSTLHHTYPKSAHSEIGVCFDVDEEHEAFTYMLGVGVDEADGDVPQRPGTYRFQVGGGLYAIFTQGNSADTIVDAWKEILTGWLPGSPYEYDEARMDFEYYDERDHDGTETMDIYVPVKAKN